MFSQLIVVLCSLAAASAFTASLRPAVRSSSLKMSAEDMVGSLAPMGFFDPLGISSGKTDVELKKIRESELKHGRVAMIAALGILTAETTNPLFGGQITG